MSQLRSLSRLGIALGVSDLKCLPIFLESCPNLKSLTLTLDDYEEMRSEEMNQVSDSSVPECLLSSLESVHFDAPISTFALATKLVNYFLENSAILKKLTLHVNRDKVPASGDIPNIQQRIPFPPPKSRSAVPASDCVRPQHG
ncbi:unnamed protein product, partial [Thlaspi arvense]